MIKAKITIKEIDRGWEVFKKAMKTLDGSTVTVGVHEGAGSYPNGASVAMVALWNEFGTVNMDERSFMRSAEKDNEAELNALRIKLMGDVVEGKLTPAKALETFGKTFQRMIEKKIQSNPPPPNMPSTLAAKERDGAGNQTLLWTRRLLKSITRKVVLK